MFVNVGTKRNKWFEIDGTVTSEPDLDMVFFVWLSLKKKKRFIWLFQMLVVACRISSCGIWDPIPRPGI